MGTEEKENWSRKYSHIEHVLRKNKNVGIEYELKATKVTNKEQEKFHE